MATWPHHMGQVLLVVLLVFEAVLSAAAGLSRQRAPQVRYVLRLTPLAVFLLLTATGTFDWGPRYWALGILLAYMFAVEAVRGLGVLARSRPQPPRRRKQVRIARAAAAWCGVGVLYALALGPVILFPPSSRPLAATGPYRVMDLSVTYTDPYRVDPYARSGPQRRVTVGYWYPVGPQGTRWPLIVFSHGALGVLSSNESLYLELASHGYVVAAVAHAGQALYVTDTSGHTTWLSLSFLSELRREDARHDPAGSYDAYRKWLTLRMADIDLVIDQAMRSAGRPGSNAALERFDGHHVGVMGHSLGGAAALSIARERPDVRAVVALEAPMLWDIVGVENAAFSASPIWP